MTSETAPKLPPLCQNAGVTPHVLSLNVAPDGTLRQMGKQEHSTEVSGICLFLEQRVPGCPATPVEKYDDYWDNLGPRHEPLPLSCQEKTVRALVALQAAAVGDHASVESFAADAELWPGAKWRGAKWGEAVSTALMGDWVDPLLHGGKMGPAAIDDLRAEARTVHRQLTPLWRRRAGGSRVLLLDTPLGDGLTLYDLVASSPDPQDLVHGTLPDDARLANILKTLLPAERTVTLLWAHPAVATWTEAALLARAPNPAAFGERVRRKLKRLGIRHTGRSLAADATRGEAL
ncbi:hypothetical protein ACFVYG_22540 [Streptomyces sp. NPDC058256]|uniref:hypothetical protein n=1 Tax=Streptomyces sp. NPDC058256 TaxID=3346408 RepID=UPI0036E3A869